MLNLHLDSNILAFVRTYGVVEERQVYKFFGNQGNAEVAYALTDLLAQERLFRLEEQRTAYFTTVRKLPVPLSDYKSRIKAIHVLCSMRSEDVLEYYTETSPVECIFSLMDGRLFDITSFPDSTYWQATATTAYHVRRNAIPRGMDDCTIHIAVVPNIDLIPQLHASLPFQHYTTVDRNGHVEWYEYQEAEKENA